MQLSFHGEHWGGRAGGAVLCGVWGQPPVRGGVGIAVPLCGEWFSPVMSSEPNPVLSLRRLDFVKIRSSNGDRLLPKTSLLTIPKSSII